MKEQLKSILNEDQDPKAIEKIAAKLDTLLMKNEEVGYIGVQKKPAITVLPDSIVMTNKRIIMCKPKNLGLSMDFIDYDWEDIAGTFVKENILGSEFSFATKTELVISIDYIPKNQARKLHIYAKEHLESLKNPIVETPIVDELVENKADFDVASTVFEPEIIEEMETEEVSHFAELITTTIPVYEEVNTLTSEKKLSEMSNDELFAKLQNHKKLLDNGLILQGEYDAFKKEILSYM